MVGRVGLSVRSGGTAARKSSCSNSFAIVESSSSALVVEEGSLEATQTGPRKIDRRQDCVPHLWRQPAGGVLLAQSTSDPPCGGQRGRASVLCQVSDQTLRIVIADFTAVDATHLSENRRA